MTKNAVASDLNVVNLLQSVPAAKLWHRGWILKNAAHILDSPSSSDSRFKYLHAILFHLVRDSEYFEKTLFLMIPSKIFVSTTEISDRFRIEQVGKIVFFIWRLEKISIYYIKWAQKTFFQKYFELIYIVIIKMAMLIWVGSFATLDFSSFHFYFETH